MTTHPEPSWFWLFHSMKRQDTYLSISVGSAKIWDEMLDRFWEIRHCATFVKVTITNLGNGQWSTFAWQKYALTHSLTFVITDLGKGWCNHPTTYFQRWDWHPLSPPLADVDTQRLLRVRSRSWHHIKAEILLYIFHPGSAVVRQLEEKLCLNLSATHLLPLYCASW